MDCEVTDWINFLKVGSQWNDVVKSLEDTDSVNGTLIFKASLSLKVFDLICFSIRSIEARKCKVVLVGYYELESMWKETAMVYFKVTVRTLSCRTEEN